LLKAAKQDPEIALKLYEAISRELLATREHLLCLGQRGACERLAAFLVVLSRRNAARGADPRIVKLPMTRLDVADFLGLTIETVSRTLSKMKRQGLIAFTPEPNPSAGNHLVTVETRVSPHLFLNDALDKEALAGSRLCGAAMTVLQCATDPDGIGLTRSGAFNRRFVTWAVDEFRWPHYTGADLALVNRVLNEDDVSPLSYLHELLLAAKLIRHAKNRVLLTKTGREHLFQPGRLQAVLFETFFTRFDFAARERWPIEMPDADTFHFLAVIHTQIADWVAYPEFAASCLPMFALPAQRGPPEEDAMFYLANRLVRPLTWLGLLEQDEARGYQPIHTIRLRKTALFDRFFRFEPVLNDIDLRTLH